MKNMEKEKLELVLEDILDELKIINNTTQQQKQQVLQLQENFFALEEKINQLNSAASPVVNIKPIQACVNEGMIKIQHTLNQQSRPIVRERRFLLFPEHYASEY